MRKLFSFLFLGCFFPGHAQSDTVQISLSDVTVTAQRMNKKNLIVPYSVNKTDDNHFKQLNPRTTPEALQGMNGVFLQKTNHGGGSAILRGLTGNQILILVDGIRLNNSTFRYGPNQYLNTIDPYTIHHLEVVKGTGSVQYGTDALGGVIHVLTKSPSFNDSGWSANALLKYMSGDMEKTASAQIAHSSEKAAFTLGFTKRDFGDIIGGGKTGRQSPSGYNEWGVNFKGLFQVTDKVVFSVAHQNVEQKNVPIYHKLVLENFLINEFDEQTRFLRYVKLEAKSSNPLIKKVEIIASHQKNIEERENQKNGSFTLIKEKDKITTLGLTANLLSEIKKTWLANTGIEFYHDKVNSFRNSIDLQDGLALNKRGLYPNNSKYTNASLYTMHHYSTRRWEIDAGLRLNTFSIQLKDSSVGDVTISPAAFVWNAAMLYKISSGKSFYVSYSTGFRTPNIDDLGSLGIVDSRYEIPASNLKPEKSTNVELGYKFQGKKLSGNVAIYYLQLKDLITRVKLPGAMMQGYQVYQKENIESAAIKGTELKLDWSSTFFKVNGTLTYTDGRNNTNKEPLRRIPPLFGGFSARVSKKNWFYLAEFLFAAEQHRLSKADEEDNRISKGGTPGWRVVNLYSGREFKHFNLQAGFQNIFDEDYRTHGSGINGVGRSFWFTTTVTF